MELVDANKTHMPDCIKKIESNLLLLKRFSEVFVEFSIKKRNYWSISDLDLINFYITEMKKDNWDLKIIGKTLNDFPIISERLKKSWNVYVGYLASRQFEFYNGLYYVIYLTYYYNYLTCLYSDFNIC